MNTNNKKNKLSKNTILSIPFFGKILLFIYRWNIVRKFISHKKKIAYKWLFSSKETTNLTYDLTNNNITHLISFLSVVTSLPITTIQQYINEISEDSFLTDHIKKTTQNSKLKFKSDVEVKFGRRIGWYVLARVYKPKTIVETGIDKGLGTCLLTRALMKNADEGFSGHYYGTDINPEAGFLFTEPFTDYGTILYGDSIQSLEKLDEQIDMFINDSEHSAQYEENEYKTIKDKLSSKSIIIADNAHSNDKLFLFSQSIKKSFLFFKETPKDHWYDGGGIGIAF